MDINQASPMELASTPIFLARRAGLCRSTYALLRSLEYACSWLILTEDVPFKLSLGMLIGDLGEVIGRLDSRLDALMTEGPRLLVCEADEDLLATGVHCLTTEDRRTFLHAILESVCRNMLALAQTSHRIGDAPTIWVLTEAARRLTSQLEGFHRPTHSASASFTAPPGNETIAFSGHEDLPALPDLPGRPKHWEFKDETVFRQTSLQNLLQRGEHLARWLHEIGINIEINAMEVCARNIVEYRSMPLAFKIDMARQIWDETRHAQMMEEHLHQIGCEFGHYTYNDKVWRKYMLGADLAERLAIEQIFQEGNALEANIPFADALNRAGATDLAEMLDYVNADEMQHAIFGNKWLKYLCETTDRNYMDVVQVAVTKLGMSLSPRGAAMPQLRKMADFPEAFITALCENQRQPDVSTDARS